MKDVDGQYAMMGSLLMPMWNFLIWILVVAARFIAVLFFSQPRLDPPLPDKPAILTPHPRGQALRSWPAVRAPPLSPSLLLP
jgi:hypothetical protein